MRHGKKYGLAGICLLTACADPTAPDPDAAFRKANTPPGIVVPVAVCTITSSNPDCWIQFGKALGATTTEMIACVAAARTMTPAAWASCAALGSIAAGEWGKWAEMDNSYKATSEAWIRGEMERQIRTRMDRGTNDPDKDDWRNQ